ncbi:MAG: UvrD-helicase domain-containing protein [Treponema sp.]|nr:UvrD-helicase domain-containing protein [Treponema sp.]
MGIFGTAENKLEQPKYFSHLNGNQLEAVKTTEGHVRVLAGAGTGKTRALIGRYCYLVRDVGISPQNILCVTFTNRAANEMKSRVRSMLGDMDLGLICTFHAFCTLLLHEDINVLNFPKNFIIFDKEDWREIMLRIFADMHITLKETTVQRKIDEVLEGKKIQADTYINYFYKLNNEELRQKFTNPQEPLEQNQEIFLRFIYEQKKCFGVDFNDLINFATYILENFPDVREKWQDRMQYVMVDEFQDVSAKQYRITQILSAKHKNLFIVGDSDQTIYSWRGSHVKLILDFDKKYPDAKTIVLSQNYRSTPQILAASNALISKNTVRYPKQLVATVPAGAKPLYFHAPNDSDEAKWICSEIKKLVKNHSAKNQKKGSSDGDGIHYHDIAILYRAHYLSRVLEETFINNDLPYRILSGTEFYGRREIKDIVCYLRMLTVQDDVAFYRTVNTPSRKIGKQKIAAIKTYAEEHGCSAYTALKELTASDTPLFKQTGATAYISAIESVRDMLPQPQSSAPTLHKKIPLGSILQTLLDRTGYEAFLRLEADQERLDNVAEFKRSVNEAGLDEDSTLETFLNHVALFTDLDRDDKNDSVRLLTIHAAKGMEFPYVFLCGMNEGIFPSRKVNTPDDMEEERRIAYVAMTRAKCRLFLSDAEGKANDGIFKYPSRFIFDAELKNLEIVKPLDDGLVAQTQKIIAYDEERLKAMRTMLSAGDRVSHPIFGSGTIALVNPNASCYIVKFDGMETERSIQFTAKLERII